jgi:hypothetical protein
VLLAKPAPDAPPGVVAEVGGAFFQVLATGVSSAGRALVADATLAPRMTYRNRFWIILGLATVLLAGCGGGSPATAVAAPFVYAVNTKSNEISQYGASSSDFGGLMPLTPATVATGSFPYESQSRGRGNGVYVADVNANEVSQYTINAITGQLAPKPPATVAAGRGSVEVAVTPQRRERLCRR